MDASAADGSGVFPSGDVRVVISVCRTVTTTWRPLTSAPTS